MGGSDLVLGFWGGEPRRTGRGMRGFGGAVGSRKQPPPPFFFFLYNWRVLKSVGYFFLGIVENMGRIRTLFLISLVLCVCVCVGRKIERMY